MTGRKEEIAGSEHTWRKHNQADFSKIKSHEELELQPGDILFIRWNMPWWSVVSKLVVSVDTFFSHAAICVGVEEPDGQMLVESSLKGVTRLPLKKVLEKAKDGACIVVGRPDRDPDEREAAADWAREQARKPEDEDVVAFDTGALGTAYVVLAKQRMRNALAGLRTADDELPKGFDKSLETAKLAVDGAIKEMREKEEEFDDPFEGPVMIPGVCAAFVWQAYAQLGRRPLIPAFLEGTRVKGHGRLGPPSMDPSVLEVLLGENQMDTFGLLDTFKKAEPVWLLLKQGRVLVPGVLKAVRGKESTSIAQMLSPADLCFSHEMKERFFLAKGHKEVAKAWQSTHNPIEVDS